MQPEIKEGDRVEVSGGMFLGKGGATYTVLGIAPAGVYLGFLRNGLSYNTAFYKKWKEIRLTKVE